ncbi:unnamed protein product [Orchesella dallaii]|uniref:Uncharacterized protein n=1 Tax=Orchesella dallaii TaxID=48710 RepID=A0ABP1S9I7_9HEXA
MQTNTFVSALLLGILLCILYLGECNAGSSASVSPAAVSKSAKITGNDKSLPITNILNRKRRQPCPTILLPPGQCISDCHCGRGEFCNPSPYRSGIRRCRSRNGRGTYGLWV